VIGTILQYFLLNIIEEERIHSMDALIGLLLQTVNGKEGNEDEVDAVTEEDVEGIERREKKEFSISHQLQHIFDNGNHLIEALCLYLKVVIMNKEKEENTLIIRRLKAVFCCEHRSKDKLLTLSQPASLVWIEILAHLLSLYEEEEIFESACNRIHLTESAKHRIIEKKTKQKQQKEDLIIPWFHHQPTRSEEDEEDRVDGVLINPSLEMKVEELIASLLHHIMNGSFAFSSPFSSVSDYDKKKSRKSLSKEEQEQQHHQQLQQLRSQPLDLFLRLSLGASYDGLMKKRNEKLLKQQQPASSSSSSTRRKSISSSSAAGASSSEEEIEKLKKELAESSLRNKELQRRVQQLDNKIEYFLTSSHSKEES
jgi:hypothetical protein